MMSVGVVILAPPVWDVTISLWHLLRIKASSLRLHTPCRFANPALRRRIYRLGSICNGGDSPSLLPSLSSFVGGAGFYIPPVSGPCARRLSCHVVGAAACRVLNLQGRWTSKPLRLSLVPVPCIITSWWKPNELVIGHELGAPILSTRAPASGRQGPQRYHSWISGSLYGA